MDLIQVLSPSSGAVFEDGAALNIIWAYGDASATLCIELCRPNGRAVHVIAARCANIGVHTWRPPTTIHSGDYLVRVRHIDAEAGAGASGGGGACACAEGLSGVITLKTRIGSYAPSEPEWRAEWRPLPRVALDSLARQPDTRQLQVVERLLSESAREPPVITIGKVPRAHRFNPQRSRTSPTTRGPAVELTRAEVRKGLKELLNTSDIHVDHELANGDTAGQFCVKYLLMTAQRREKKERKQ